MGQYYDVYFKQGKKEHHYNKKIKPKCEYMMAKLTEHSWWENDFCRALAYKLIDKPGIVAWVGDYTEDTDPCGPEINEKINGTDGEKNEPLYIKPEAIDSAPEGFRLENCILINLTKKIYMPLNEYFVRSLCDGWCLFPISILTATSNGRGGGDYHGVNKDVAGTWALDSLMLVEKNEFYKEQNNKYSDFQKFMTVFEDI